MTDWQPGEDEPPYHRNRPPMDERMLRWSQWALVAIVVTGILLVLILAPTR